MKEISLKALDESLSLASILEMLLWELHWQTGLTPLWAGERQSLAGTIVYGSDCLNFMTGAVAPPPRLARLSLGGTTWSRRVPADRFGVPARPLSEADLQLPLGNSSLSARLCMCVLGLPLCLTPMC